MSQARPHDSVRVEDMTTLPANTTVEDLLVRVEMDKTRSQMAIEENTRLADVYFGKAKKFVREGDYFNAIQYGKLAISYSPEDARYYFLLADCQVRNPEARWQRLAEQNYIKATQLDSWNAEYLVSLGRFYKRRGLKLRARKQFEQALQLVPAHAIAMQELESL
jgi:Flp pilus assembly protein TadD